MKKILFIFAVLCVFAIGAKAQECVSVASLDVSSYAYTTPSAWFPSGTSGIFIATGVVTGRIQDICVTNSATSTVQTVSFYEWGTVSASSTSARLIWSIVVGGTTDNQSVMQSFTERFPLIFTRGLVVRKSSPDTTVGVSVNYR